MKKTATFIDGVIVAFIAALSGAILLAVLPSIFGMDLVIRMVVAGISFSYILYLLRRSHETVGRVTVIAVWTVLTAIAWLLHLPLLLYMGAQLGAIWLIRSLYFYSSPLSALMDLGLQGLALVGCAWIYLQTGSIFLSIWGFFLTQALFTIIPDRSTTTDSKTPDQSQQFEQAHQAAQAAVSKLTTAH